MGNFQGTSTFCAVENVRSQNVLIKSGFIQQKLLEKWAKFSAFGEDVRDCIGYKMQMKWM